eukprot:TRINITY_DN65643_c0_g1_i1.p1 TRINITY_DN65643_c0_g1~~TRINITY_DN65643_c0_g1_i1.p1  ORF type:complete len:433 (+),score=65.14 TRINITY_DN65643_c0_g1_i1:49-1347(+)
MSSLATRVEDQRELASSPRYTAVARDQPHSERGAGFCWGHLVTAAVSTVASCALFFALHALLASSTGGDKGTYIEHVNIDINTQNGATANVHAGVDFGNDMSGSFYGNNDASSGSGDVTRFNGAYDNNAIAGHGNVIRANGAMDNNALAKDGDVTRSNGVVTSARLRGRSSSISGFELANGLQEDSHSASDIQTSGISEDMEHILSNMRKPSMSSKDKVHLEHALAEFHAMKQAKKEERTEHLIQILKILYGKNSSLHGGAAASSSAVIGPLLNDFKAVLTNQRYVIQSLVDGLNTTLVSGQSLQPSESVHQNRTTTLDDIGNLEGILKGLEADSKGPVHIDDVNIKIRHQNGLQANLGAGITFRNNMSNTFHNNNDATSESGHVSRINGAYDNNAKSSRGSVLRVNGAFDNNAGSMNGSVLRQNGVFSDSA